MVVVGVQQIVAEAGIQVVAAGAADDPVVAGVAEDAVVAVVPGLRVAVGSLADRLRVDVSLDVGAFGLVEVEEPLADEHAAAAVLDRRADLVVETVRHVGISRVVQAEDQLDLAPRVVFVVQRELARPAGPVEVPSLDVDRNS